MVEQEASALNWPSSRRLARCHRSSHLWLILFASTMVTAEVVADAINISSSIDTEQNMNQLVKPTQLPPQSILLENGLTTFVSSLEDYIERQQANKQPDAAEESLKNPEAARARPQRLTLGETTTVELSTHSSVNKPEAHEERHHGASGSHHAAAAHTGNASTKPTPQYWQVKSLLNVTHDYPLAYSQIICGYVWPLIAAITMFTNLMIVFVLTQRDMRTPTNVVLTAIAIADIIPIVVPVPWFVYLFAMGNDKKVLYPPILCYFYQHSTRSVSEVFYFLSTWLNVLLACHDYLTACWPKLAKKYCQIKFVVMEIISLTLLAFLLNLPQALKLVYKPVKFIYNGQVTWGCRALQAKWFKELVGEYVALYDDIFAAVIVLFVDGGPAIALIVFTALLIRQLHRQRIKGHLLMEQARTASKRRRERHRQQEYESSARVMIFVLLAFLAVKLPFATTYTLMIIQSRFEIHFVENLNDFQKAITLIDLFFVLSYPLNFTIFCCCSKKFRHKCVQLLAECDRNTQSAKKRLLVKLTDSYNASFNSSAYSQDDPDDEIQGKHRHHKSNSVGTVYSIGSGASLIACANHHHTAIKELRRLSDIERRERMCNGPRQVSFEGQHKLDPHFKALLEEGNICLECIIHYEHLKHSRKRLTGAEHQEQRRISTESNNWPPPPPLPSIHISQFPMSSSIVLDCGGGEERAVSEGADTLELRESQLTPSGELDEVGAAGRGPEAVSGGPSSDRNNLTLYRSEGSDDKVEPGDERSKGRLSREQSRRKSSARGRSDPGSSILRKLSDLMKRSDATLNAEAAMEASASNENIDNSEPLSRMIERHRSLSMSNSKLSALPDATGFLADILKATLLAPPDEQQIQQNRASSLGSSNLSRRRDNFARRDR